jgi:hypothetical protein
VQRLNIHKLARSLSNTNLIENCFEQVAHRARRVKRWNGARMILRWTASALLWAERRFKRLNGCEQLPDPEKNLRLAETSANLKAA